MFDAGIRLQLMIGPTIPVPAPYEVLDALRSVEVNNNDEKRDGFELKFTLGKDTLAGYSLLENDLLDPPNRVIITVLLSFSPIVLIDGIITNHQFQPGNRPGETTLIVTGEDISLLLDLEEKNATYPNQADALIVTRLLASYAFYDIIPQVTSTDDVPAQAQRTPAQQATDLTYIRQLAKRNGFIFYIEPAAPFRNIAYWGPDNRLGLPQSALNVDMGTESNVEAFGSRFDALGPVEPRLSIMDPFTGLTLPVPLSSGFRPSLSGSPAVALRKTILRENANLSLAQAMLRALSAVGGSSDAATVSGQLDTVRYGGILRSRRLVGVRGAGARYNGNYYVKQVKHSIERGTYKQNFELTREGQGVLAPTVVP